MATLQRSYNCRTCGGPTLHTKAIFGDGWGLLLSILTAGIFLPFWFLIVIGQRVFGRFRCQTCGRSR